MTPAAAKKNLRSAVRVRLRENAPQSHVALQAQLGRLLARENAECCIGYLAFQQEPVLDQFLGEWLELNRKILLPRFNSATMSYELVEVTDLTSQIVPGHYGIREPIQQLTEIKRLKNNTFWLVPGLAFTTCGTRLGRGAGHYDRLFAKFPQGKRIGIAWEMQLLPEIPQEPWDFPMDYIVTEMRTIDCRAPLT
ncbi:MAG: 5-formyltetrahydrofolate cyclo-ligase [Victivallales bacterium]|nr:5-formyltetrahydrofolate cyclo-ligase [Victivallales bacterium]